MNDKSGTLSKIRRAISYWFNCIMRANHNISEEDEQQLYDLGLGFYNTKCRRCGEEVRLETIKGDEDHFMVRFEPAE